MMSQVAQLRVENSTLVQRLQEISQKFQEAAVDNRVLKADVGALRAKVDYQLFLSTQDYEVQACAIRREWEKSQQLFCLNH